MTQVPALLDDGHRQILQRAKSNRTYTHGQQKHFHLLSRMIFCSHCGYAMFGQLNHNGKRYYRHAHSERVNACKAEKCWVPVNEIEDVSSLSRDVRQSDRSGESH